MRVIDGTTLANMDIEELTRLYNQMPEYTLEQKKRAWAKMDTGIYNEKGELIGYKCDEEDVY